MKLKRVLGKKPEFSSELELRLSDHMERPLEVGGKGYEGVG